MAIVLFILIAGLWAAFLLPSFFDHRNQTPKSTTKDFARTKQLLAAVSASDPDGEAYVRKHAQIRRTRILIALGASAALTLAVATWTGSSAWLYTTIAIDVTIAVYVAGLLHMKRQRLVPRAKVVPISAVAAVASAPAAQTPVPDYGESATVRVIAG